MNDINLEILAEIRKLRCLTLWSILNLLVFAAALGAAYWLVAHRSTPAAANARHHVPPLASPAIPGVLDKSIVVLPFQNLSDDQQISYFAEGVLEEVLLKLDKVADLEVISFSNVMQHKAVLKRNLCEVGQQLGAAYLLEGSVRRVDNHVRVHVQLIDAGRDKTIWAETYDRELPMYSL